MIFRVRVDFVCHDHRLVGSVEFPVEELAVYRATVKELVDAADPFIVAKYPFVADALDFVEVTALHLTAGA